MLSALGILSLLVAVLPTYAIPYYVTALACSMASIMLLRQHSRLIPVPVTVACVSVAGLVAWPYAVGVFPSDNPVGAYRLSYGNRWQEERLLFLDLKPDSQITDMIHTRGVWLKIHFDKYPHPGKLMSEDNYPIPGTSEEVILRITSLPVEPIRLPYGNYQLSMLASAADAPGLSGVFLDRDELIIISPYDNRVLEIPFHDGSKHAYNKWE